MYTNKNITLNIGVTLVSILFLMMIVSLFWTPYPPNELHTSDRLVAPNAQYWFGTDNFGRDILSRIMEASQTAFLIGISTLAIALTGGLIIGGTSGYFGGVVDEILMRIIDALLAIPGLLLAIMLITIFHTGLWNTVLAIGVMGIPTFARVIRSGFLQIKNNDYVTASRLKGASHLWLIRQHILPNVMTPIIVVSTLYFSGAILAESALSFLGLGVQEPDASWGRMINEARPYLATAPWYILISGGFIIMLVLGFNLIGDGLRHHNESKR